MVRFAIISVVLEMGIDWGAFLTEIPEKKQSKLLKFLSYFGGAISFLLEIATIVSAIVGDWIDFGILLFVLIVNACIGYYVSCPCVSYQLPFEC